MTRVCDYREPEMKETRVINTKPVFWKLLLQLSPYALSHAVTSFSGSYKRALYFEPACICRTMKDNTASNVIGNTWVYSEENQWRIQDFSEGGSVNSQSRCANLFFLPKTAWKWKNLTPGGERHWRLLRSATENIWVAHRPVVLLLRLNITEVLSLRWDII